MSDLGPANKARRNMLAAALAVGATAPGVARLNPTNSSGTIMAGSLLPQPKQLFQDANWNPLIGGKIYTYAAGTLTPKTTYQDTALTIANTNPTVANARGEVLMYGAGAYRVILKDAAGNTIYDVDNIESSQSIVDSLRQDLGQASGANIVSFQQLGAGAVTRALQTELRETIKLTQYFVLVEASIAPAFERAFAAFTRPGELQIPQGFYNLAAQVTVRRDIPIKIRGAGINSTIIFYSGAGVISSMFTQTGGISDTLELSDMTLLGNGKAQAGFSSENIIASLFKNLSIQGTTVAAIRTNNGYSNTFDNCKIFSNAGGGIQCTGINNNNILIHNSQVYDNGGIGIEVGNGFSVTISGECDIETNAQAGIVAYDIKRLTIRDSYIERNGAAGYAYKTTDGSPENLTVHSDIHILAGGKSLSGTRDTAVTQCIIDGVQFTPYGSFDFPTAGLSIDSPIFATIADGLSVTNCEVLVPGKIKQMVSLYNNNTRSAVYQAKIDQNTVNTVGFLGTGNSAFAFNTAHNIDTPLAQSPHNYAAQDIATYGILSGSTGSFRRASADYQGYPVYALAAGDYQFGYDLDITKNPELLGKIVWFGVWYNVADAGSTVQLTIGGASDSDGSVFDDAMVTGNFAFKSVCKLVSPGDTSFFISIKRIGSGVQPVLICHPVVSMMGFGGNRYPIPSIAPIWRATAPPTTGTWKVGDRKINVSPAVGQPKAWVCTVPGTPGTWVSEGNL